MIIIRDKMLDNPYIKDLKNAKEEIHIYQESTCHFYK